MLEFYWEMGRDLSILKKDAKWGSAFFDCVSLDMKAEFPGETGFSSRNIRYMYDWYTFYNQDNIILQRAVAKLRCEDEINLHQVGSKIRHHLDDELQEVANKDNIIPHQSNAKLEMPHDFGLIPWLSFPKLFEFKTKYRNFFLKFQEKND